MTKIAATLSGKRLDINCSGPVEYPDPEVPITRFWLPTHRPLTAEECRAMAGGHAPEWLQAICREMVEWSLQTGRIDYVGLNAQYQQQQRLEHRKRLAAKPSIQRPHQRKRKRRGGTR